MGYVYFDETNIEDWNLADFHQCWIDLYRDLPNRLSYERAIDYLIKSLRAIIETSSDSGKVNKAVNILEKAKVTYSIFFKVVLPCELQYVLPSYSYERIPTWILFYDLFGCCELLQLRKDAYSDPFL
ncbi:hypothetical protein BC938DRAFT_474650 [Jimgerdemannia flammicorona]|uniref:Uncharacterized protein n=1 Tax=Jimgerdemannia flammicorona TaxID=994334 RepID=A0A433Q1V6_9FUNG|nr:hypothetical protein BC938DRAFT_474650 [Jimgerdemannia flammicorona]